MEEKEMSLSMDLDEVNIKGDPAFLEKVWENLLSNALKYTGVNGEIEIELIMHGNRVEVITRDNGIGIEEENLKRIFDRFYRIDHSRTGDITGTGLGLSIVQQVVKLHGGTISVVSNKDKGTTFTVTLPNL